jgi:hypothetical protein
VLSAVDNSEEKEEEEDEQSENATNEGDLKVRRSDLKAIFGEACTGVGPEV